MRQQPRGRSIAMRSVLALALALAAASTAQGQARVALAPSAANDTGATRAESSACPAAMMQAVGRHFGLARFSLPTDQPGETAETAGRLIAATCRPWKAARGQTVAAFIYDGDETTTKPLLLVLLGRGGRQVVASHRSALEVNGATELSRDSLRLDATAWQLAPGRPAIGLRMRTFRDRCQFEGGLDQVFRLFRHDGGTLRPVLAVPTEHWRWAPGNRCLQDEAPSTARVSAQVRVSLHPAHAGGPTELELTATRSDGVPPLRLRLKPRGTGYDLAGWDQAFSRWFD